MITAMVKLPDGKVLNKILSESDVMLETAIDEDLIQDWANGVVRLTFKDMCIMTHWSNVVIIAKDSQ